MPTLNKYITISEFNKLTKENFDQRMKEAAKNLATKSKIQNALDLVKINKKTNKKINIKRI